MGLSRTFCQLWVHLSSQLFWHTVLQSRVKWYVVQNLYFYDVIGQHQIMKLVRQIYLVKINVDYIFVLFQVRQILSLCPNITHLDLTQTNVTDFAFDR